MTATAPLSWLKEIKEIPALCQKIPLWGSCPLFPWEKVSKALEEQLAVQNFTLRFSASDLVPPEEFFSSLGKDPLAFFLELSPLSGYLIWVLSKESVESISSNLLSLKDVQNIADSRFQEGFYQFLLLEASRQIESLKVYPNLHIQWIDKQKLPNEPCLAVDVSIGIGDQSFLGRLIATPQLQDSFSNHFSTSFIKDSSPVYPDMTLFSSLEIGSCLVSQEEWKNIKIGDFLLLDRCSYDPQSGSGTATLVLQEKPCFIIKIKKNSLKILDYAVYHGDAHIMNDEEFPPTFEEELPFPPSEENTSEENNKEEEGSSEKEIVQQPASPPPEILTSPEKIPFPIIVEVGRIQMSLEKLLQLAPGNILELNVRPEQGVYLAVHGRRIAKGELIKVGEVLGVKIVEIGNTPAT